MAIVNIAISFLNEMIEVEPLYVLRCKKGSLFITVADTFKEP